MTEKLSTEDERFLEIKRNIETVRGKIAAAAKRSGRNPDEITLVAVTKTMPASDVAAALGCGVTIFGENRVQELLTKLPQLDVEGREAHIIGHLQTNKVRQVIGKADMIQSVDSLHLAQEIETQAQRAGRIMNVLVEVNIGGEDSKSGVAPGALQELLDGMVPMTHIHIRGLMTIPPVCPNPEDARQYFEKMRNLFIDIGRQNTDNRDMHILSMGMSADYEIAVEEGSTMVRVGTAIFGRR